MATSEIATLPGYEQFGPWLLVEKSGHVHVVSTNRPEAFNAVNEEVHHAFTTPELHERATVFRARSKNAQGLWQRYRRAKTRDLSGDRQGVGRRVLLCFS